MNLEIFLQLFSIVCTAPALVLPDCTQVIHLRLPPNELDAIGLTEQLQISQPVIIATKIWPSETIEPIWSHPTICIQHMMVTKYAFGMKDFFDMYRPFSCSAKFEREYFLTLIVTKGSDDVNNFAYDQFYPSVANNLDHSRRMHNWNLVFVEQDMTTAGLFTKQVLYAKLSCYPTNYPCLVRVNPSNYKEILFGNWLKKQQVINLFRSPILINRGQSPIFIQDKYNYDYASTHELRYILARNTKNFKEPVSHICGNLARRLNATAMAKSIAGGAIAPEVTPFHDTSLNFRPGHRKVHVGHFNVKFLYCWNRTDPHTANALAFFIPFDLQTWTFVGLSSALTTWILWKTVGQYLVFSVFAAMLTKCEMPSKRCYYFTLLIWIGAAGFLNNIYATFIQSVLVVPTQKEFIDDFQTLDSMSYQIVANDWPGSHAAKFFREGTSFFQGIDYIDSLRDRVEFIDLGNNDQSHLSYVVRNPGKTMVMDGSEIETFKTAAEFLFDGIECHVGRKGLVGSHLGWSIYPPYASPIRNILDHYFTSGILQLMTETAWKRYLLFLHRMIVEPDEEKWDAIEWEGGIDERKNFTITLQNDQFQLILKAFMGSLLVVVAIFTLEIRARINKLLDRTLGWLWQGRDPSYGVNFLDSLAAKPKRHCGA